MRDMVGKILAFIVLAETVVVIGCAVIIVNLDNQIKALDTHSGAQALDGLVMLYQRFTWTGRLQDWTFLWGTTAALFVIVEAYCAWMNWAGRRRARRSSGYWEG